MEWLKMNWRKLIPPIAASALILTFILYTKSHTAGVPADSFIPVSDGPDPISADDRADLSAAVIFVDVKGAVEKPGVYKAEEGDRVIDAVARAGGFLPDAVPDAINHAERLRDEMVIYVPFIMPEDAGQTGSAPPPVYGADDGKVNLNTAEADELMTLPGIGPAKAEAIIAHRTEHGPFADPAGLMDVSGIGEKTFAALEELITAK
ncbi:MAG: helix-hairpin-helix domain-containing protein [Bhargavaea sp.]